MCETKYFHAEIIFDRATHMFTRYIIRYGPVSLCLSQAGVLIETAEPIKLVFGAKVTSETLSLTLSLADFSAFSPRHVHRRKFITRSVHHCLQHRCDVSRRAVCLRQLRLVFQTRNNAIGDSSLRQRARAI